MILTPEKWVQNGYTIARTEPDRKTVFIHGALPGLPVKIKTIKTVSTHLFAVSEENIVSDCRAFPLCGGCSFRHIPYEEELTIKKRLLGELRFLGRYVSQFSFFQDSPDGYRNHIQIQFDPESGLYGFFSLLSNEIAALPEEGCRHLSKKMNNFIQAWFREKSYINYLKKYNNYLNKKINKKIKIPFREEGGSVVLPEEIMNKKILEFSAVSEKGVFRWKYASDGFFQANRFLTPVWLQKLASWAYEIKQSVTELRAAELFCGSALIGGYLLPYLDSWTGWESDSSSVKAACENLADSGRPESDRRLILEDIYKNPPIIKGKNLIIVNPPRAGLGEKVIRSVIQSGSEFLIYSSCNPHTLDRDALILEKGGYAFLEGAVFDFFPRTPHLETALLMKKI